MKVSEVQAGSEFPRTDEDTKITSKSGVNESNLLIFFSNEP